MRVLAQNDYLRKQQERLQEAEAESAERMQQIAREAYAYTESNLYAIRPEKSHVSMEFAAGDSEFWMPKLQKPAKTTVRKRTTDKAKQQPRR
jgi:hypothetical protein